MSKCEIHSVLLFTHHLNDSMIFQHKTENNNSKLVTRSFHLSFSHFPSYILAYNVVFGNIRVVGCLFLSAGLTVNQFLFVLICIDWTGGSKCSEGIKPTAFSPSTSSFHIFLTEDEAFGQLKGMDPLSNLLWPETFGQACSEETAWVRPQQQKYLIWTLHILSDVWNIHMHDLVFHTNSHTSLHKYPSQQLWGTNKHTHTHTQSERHITSTLSWTKSLVTTQAPEGP